jgi:integrase
MFTSSQVNDYIASKELAWAETTKKTERSRLMANLAHINKGAAHLATLKINRYALKTLFIRAGELAEFCKVAENEFKAFLKTNALFFKNAYDRKVVEVSFEEAKGRILRIKRAEVRELALAMLTSGMRAAEALSYDGGGQVAGKGSKLRDIYIDANLKELDLDYSSLYYELKKVGLTPHQLRKLFASKVVERGAGLADLLTLMGWADIKTAQYYLQAKDKSKLSALVGSVQD